MTPEQALEVATEIVENVQAEALKKYGELVKTNQLPKPTPDSKFTPETKEKAERYLKELEESEKYDSVEAELIHKVVTKKEERLFKVKQDISVDITDDEMHKSENMLNELRAELNRESVTDEDLTTDITQELLAEKHGRHQKAS
jgi:RNA-splicing ligase RtcB